ncbi:MAG TPA: hypothetical protein VGJ33_18665 [Candidatus Angelobacter sp.]
MAEKIAKAAALVLAVSYALGVLISNQYLMALGVSDFASLRPKYIITGLWTIVLILLAVLPIWAAKEATSFPRSNKIVAAGVLFVVACAFLVALEPFVFSLLGYDIRLIRWFTGDASRNDIAKIKSFYRACFSVILLVWSGIACSAIMIARIKRMARSSGRQMMAMYAIVGLFVCTTLASVGYTIANNIYGHIPAASGGGRPLQGRLILNKDGEAFWAEARITGTHNIAELQFRVADPFITPRSRVATVFYEDDHSMVLEIDNSHGGEPETVFMVLSKSLVDAFIIDRTP